jgi:hypothetical protein
MATARHARAHTLDRLLDGAEHHIHEQHLEASSQGRTYDGLVLLGAEDGLDDKRPLANSDQIPNPALALVGRPDVGLFEGKLGRGS